MSEEKVKRLTPKKETLRELYLKSGNQCAFPGCNNLMMNYNGDFTGQICHIEAAEPGGERFNPDQTNEERRSLENLVLLCYQHHVHTNHVEKYTVEVLKKIKKDHENKFSNLISKLQNSIRDLTELQGFSYTESCKRINEILEWGHNTEELIFCTKEVNTLLDKLKVLPTDTLNVFLIMLKRSTSTRYEREVIIHEIEKVTGEDRWKIKEHYDLLLKYNLISEAELDENLTYHVTYIQNFNSGWPFWDDLIMFSEKTGISLEEFVLQLNFSRLD